MGPTSDQSERKRAQSALNLTLAAVAGQVGCLTSLIVLAALFGGLWLDNRFNSLPMFTIGLIIASVPVTLAAMIWVVRAATSRIKSGTQQDPKTPMKEEITGE